MYVLLISVTVLTSSPAAAYRVGVGRADCTGPPVEITFVSSVFLIMKSWFDTHLVFVFFCSVF